MSTRTEPWAQGTPNWVDLGSPDPAASQAFYGSLFGWDIEDTGPDTGHYGLCRLGGRRVAGIGPQMGGDGAPPAWLTYIAVDDVDKAAEAVTTQGGAVVAPPITVGAAGRMAVAQDPTGAVVGLWQAGDTIGAERFNEPGALVWNEQMSSDTARARDFYGSVFGYTFTPVEGAEYWTFSLPDAQESCGGIGALPTGAVGLPPHWMAYFMVEDTDACAARARELGGTITQEPVDTPFGRLAVVVVDPHGATFSIMSAPAPEED